MTDLILIASIAGQKVALRTGDVQSVIEIEGLTPVPCAPLHVAGLSTLRSRVLTVIDPQMALGLGECARREAGAPAVVVFHEGHTYALLLDCVEDVARLDPIQRRSTPSCGETGAGCRMARSKQRTVRCC